MKNSRLNLFSLFSGAGGMDIGFWMTKRFNLLMANDILVLPAQTYSHNFHHRILEVGAESLSEVDSSAYLLGDISSVQFESVKQNDLDVVAGGPPCQDFSVVRGPQKERQGIDVKRGRLYAHFVRALIHLQPKVFIFENVPGLKSANQGAAFRTIIEDFSNLNLRWDDIRKIVGNSFENDIKNYSLIFSDIVDSSFLGVPQKRRRLIIMGVRSDLVGNDLFYLESLKQQAEAILFGKSSLLRKYPLTPLEAFEGLPLPELGEEYRRIMREYKGTAEAVKTEKAHKWENNVWKKLTFDAVKDYLAVNGIVPADSSEVERAFKEHIKVLKQLGYYRQPLEGRDFPDGSNAVPLEKKEVLERQSMIPPDENCEFVRGTKWEVEGRGMSLIYRRIHPLKPSYTVVAYGGGGTWSYHYKRKRGKLTNRERARLQTFPDWYIFKGGTSAVRAQIGEAVPAFMGKKIAETAQMVLEKIK